MVEVVFVHLGPSKAPHLWRNIRSIKRQFPEIEVHLIYSSEEHKAEVERTDVRSFFYQTSKSDETLLNQMDSDSKFRNGFWRYSFERLLALEFFHHSLPDGSGILHLESDIAIMPDFPFEIFSKVRKLSWTKFNDSHDVSALLYSPNQTQTSWLAKRLREEIERDTSLTDMTALSAIHDKNPEIIEYLPTISTGPNAIFPGVFDGAAIGMWLTGRDPRNSFGVVQRNVRLPEAFDDASRYRFDISKSGLLKVQRGDQQLSIYNLHIHSKKLGLFGSLRKQFLQLDVLRSISVLPSNTFSLKALHSIARDFISRHGVKGLLRKIYTQVKDSIDSRED
jgi:hypothetical protein